MIVFEPIPNLTNYLSLVGTRHASEQTFVATLDKANPVVFKVSLGAYCLINGEEISSMSDRLSDVFLLQVDWQKDADKYKYAIAFRFTVDKPWQLRAKLYTDRDEAIKAAIKNIEVHDAFNVRLYYMTPLDTNVDSGKKVTLPDG